MAEQTPQQTEAKPAAPEAVAAPASQPATADNWFAPKESMQRPDPFDVLGSVQLRPMEPMRPANLGEAIAHSMAPVDMNPHLDAPMMDVGDQQQNTATMFRRPGTQGYTGGLCPMNTIGNCIYCSALPCAVLKAKVLEVVAMEYKLMAGQRAS
jgi:hypothetical protein